MKLAYINPTESGEWFKAGRCRKVGHWTYSDYEDDTSVTRVVAHRDHVMGQFVLPKPNETKGWDFVPISTGWGSASDQQGMNKIMPTGWKFRRNGGHARYEFNGVEYKC